LHIQRLVRRFAIELFAKAIKPALLTAAGVSWRSRGLGFERAMHALVAAVLLRFTRFDELGENPKAHPPSGELR